MAGYFRRICTKIGGGAFCAYFFSVGKIPHAFRIADITPVFTARCYAHHTIVQGL